VAVERRPNGLWVVGRADEYGRIADPDETIRLRIGELAESPYDQPEERERCLRELAENKAERGYLLAWLADEVDAAIEHFHGSVPLAVTTPAEVMAVAEQAALCRAWLDYWQGRSDYQAGQAVSPGVLLLWRRYARALSVLYELEPASPALDDAAWHALTSWHDLDPEYRRGLRNWSRILLDPLSEGFVADNLTRTSATDQEPIDTALMAKAWEQEVRDLLWRPDGELRRFFHEQNAGRRFLDRVARQWFLPRYDLLSVGRIVQSRLQAAGAPHWLTALYDVRIGMPWLLPEFIALLLVAGAWAGGVGRGWLAQLWGGAVVLEGVVLVGVALVGSLLAAWRLGRSALYPFSLRLATGTFVGLVALSGFNEQFDAFTFNAFCPGQSYGREGTVALLVLSLSAALAYAFSNALNWVSDRRLALRRAGSFFLFGWAQATVFAAAASWLVAGRLVPVCFAEPCVLPCHRMEFLAGTLYFDYILAGGILAFVVGVFTQILGSWGDYSIPEPL